MLFLLTPKSIKFHHQNLFLLFPLLSVNSCRWFRTLINRIELTGLKLGTGDIIKKSRQILVEKLKWNESYKNYYILKCRANINKITVWPNGPQEILNLIMKTIYESAYKQSNYNANKNNNPYNQNGLMMIAN